ncbi:YbaL family putative K(+) efflux transporter [Microbulbifer sp. YPW1]|uniref:YbaL family putative K(+) efflux transporter n=1 Tax=Microbulbifer sp. YPW1 TaxID=2745199 RepID=UPI00159B5025|nr:YbaL family putative K(+) efflux transporter [Microbulbifer sp. YPW1]QKX16046.1 Kef family K(+) transporter [Microbulbifer sp. YPW1]
MHHNVELITTISVALGLALVLGFAAVRLRMPALLGYMIAGVLIGPATPGFVADVELSQQLAEIGVILLMFGVGLHFSLSDLMAVRRIAILGALAQILVATVLGASVARWWGWEPGASVVFGLALSVASTVVLLRGLESRGLLDTLNGRIAVGWLIVEDLVMVFALVVLPALAGWLGGAGASGGDSDNLLVTVGLTLGKVGIFIALMLVGGGRFFPWLLWQVARTGSRELFTLGVIAIAMGIAYFSSVIFGVSFALGAFFAGMVLRESALSHRAAEESLPLRDAFAVLFFVSVGMLFDPAMLLQEPLRVMTVVAIIVFGKTIAAFLLVLLFRYPLNTALTVSVSLAQIGEFSFILAALGISLSLLPQEGLNLIVAGALISIALNPLLFNLLEPMQRWIRVHSRLARAMERSTDPLAELPMTTDLRSLTGHALIVGYGDLGSRIGTQLRQTGMSIVVADTHRERVEALRAEGIPAVCGDGADEEVLIQAHVARARMLIVTVPDTLRSRKMLETAKLLRPGISILVCAESEEVERLLLGEGATAVFVGERELALNMGRFAVEHLAGQDK